MKVVISTRELTFTMELAKVKVGIHQHPAFGIKLTFPSPSTLSEPSLEHLQVLSHRSLCMQGYPSKLSVEKNSLRKFRRYYGGDWSRMCTELDTGYCMYGNNGKAKVVRIPLFRLEKVLA